MKYTEEMILHSSSGYCMPFEEQKGKEVEMLFGYGNHKKEDSDEIYFNHGIDFKAKNYLLSAVATGIVTSVGNERNKGVYQTIRYGNYAIFSLF